MQSAALLTPDKVPFIPSESECESEKYQTKMGKRSKKKNIKENVCFRLVCADPKKPIVERQTPFPVLAFLQFVKLDEFV